MVKVQTVRGFTILEIITVIAIIGIAGAIAIKPVIREASVQLVASEVYKDMVGIAEYYAMRRSCSPSVPTGFPQGNPVNNDPYIVTCGRDVLWVTTTLDFPYSSYFASAGNSINGNKVSIYRNYTSSEASYIKRRYYNETN